ncbi:MAG: hypothetical protein WA741_13730 [Candidatus Sulfotelmatobacter sp.]
MRNDTGWSKLTPQQKRSRVIMQLNKIEDEAVFDAREGGPCTPEVVARWCAPRPKGSSGATAGRSDGRAGSRSPSRL